MIPDLLLQNTKVTETLEENLIPEIVKKRVRILVKSNPLMLKKKLLKMSSVTIHTMPHVAAVQNVKKSFTDAQLKRGKVSPKDALQ